MYVKLRPSYIQVVRETLLVIRKYEQDYTDNPDTKMFTLEYIS